MLINENDSYENDGMENYTDGKLNPKMKKLLLEYK